MTDTATDGPAGTGAPCGCASPRVSDVGRHRKENQDSGYASEHLLVVADGVGGAAYGDVASSTAVHLLRRLDDEPTDEMLPALAGVVHRIHDRLAEMVENDDELDGTSTTVTAALFDGQRLGFAHVGDSRAYLLRDGARRADHQGPHVRPDAHRRGPDHRGGRAGPPAPQHHPAGRRRRARHRARPLPRRRSRPATGSCSAATAAPGRSTDGQIGRAARRGGSVDSAAHRRWSRPRSTAAPPTTSPSSSPRSVRRRRRRRPRRPAAATTPARCSSARRPPSRAAGGMLGRRAVPQRQQRHRRARRRSPDGRAGRPRGAALRPRAPPRRRAGLRRLLFVLVPLVLVAAVRRPARYAWTQQQYYVAADGPQVAIYQGVQVDLPGVEPVSRPYEVDDARGRRAARRSTRSRSRTASSPTTSTTPGASWPTSRSRRQSASRPRPRPTRRGAAQAAEQTARQRPTGGSNRRRRDRARPSPTRAASRRRAPPPTPDVTDEPGAGERLVSAASAPEFVHRRRRGAELVLLLLALAVGIGAYAAVGLGVRGGAAGRHDRLLRLARRPRRRRPRRRPVRRAVRRPGAAAGRRPPSTGSGWR